MLNQNNSRNSAKNKDPTIPEFRLEFDYENCETVSIGKVLSELLRIIEQIKSEKK